MKPMLCNSLIVVSCLFLVEATGADLTAKQVVDKTKGGSSGSMIHLNEMPDIVFRSMNIHGSILKGRKSMLRAEDAVRIANGRCYFDMSYALENTGNVKTTPFRYVLKLNNKKVNSHNNIVLEKGEFESYYYEIGLKPGLNEVMLKADNKNKVHESNENNNKLKKPFVVVGDCSNAIDGLVLDIDKPTGKVGTKIKPSRKKGGYTDGISIQEGIELKKKLKQ